MRWKFEFLFSLSPSVFTFFFSLDLSFSWEKFWYKFSLIYLNGSQLKVCSAICRSMGTLLLRLFSYLHWLVIVLLVMIWYVYDSLFSLPTLYPNLWLHSTHIALAVDRTWKWGGAPLIFFLHTLTLTHTFDESWEFSFRISSFFLLLERFSNSI